MYPYEPMETMDPIDPTTRSGRRSLAPVPWHRDGCDVLHVGVDGGVPRFEEPMVRDAVARASLECERVDGLERMLNRELWRIGYVSRIERDPGDGSIVRVEVASGR